MHVKYKPVDQDQVYETGCRHTAYCRHIMNVEMSICHIVGLVELSNS